MKWVEFKVGVGADIVIDMYLPTPNGKEVEGLKKLAKELLGLEMTDAEAHDGATRLLQLVVLTSPDLQELYRQFD